MDANLFFFYWGTLFPGVCVSRALYAKMLITHLQLCSVAFALHAIAISCFGVNGKLSANNCRIHSPFPFPLCCGFVFRRLVSDGRQPGRADAKSNLDAHKCSQWNVLSVWILRFPLLRMLTDSVNGHCSSCERVAIETIEWLRPARKTRNLSSGNDGIVKRETSK